MLKKILIFAVLSAIGGAAWYLNLRFQGMELAKLGYSFLVVAASYVILKVLLDAFISRKIKDSRARYSFRKTIQFLFIVVSFVVILRIRVPNPQALLVAYDGLVTAGVAIASQTLTVSAATSDTAN